MLCARIAIGSVLDHPGGGRGGTSSMNKHIEGVNCRKAARKPEIKQMMGICGMALYRYTALVYYLPTLFYYP